MDAQWFLADNIFSVATRYTVIGLVSFSCLKLFVKKFKNFFFGGKQENPAGTAVKTVNGMDFLIDLISQSLENYGSMAVKLISVYVPT
jgi:hypothetical protein